MPSTIHCSTLMHANPYPNRAYANKLCWLISLCPISFCETTFAPEAKTQLKFNDYFMWIFHKLCMNQSQLRTLLLTLFELDAWTIVPSRNLAHQTVAWIMTFWLAISSSNFQLFYVSTKQTSNSDSHNSIMIWPEICSFSKQTLFPWIIFDEMKFLSAKKS